MECHQDHKHARGGHVEARGCGCSQGESPRRPGSRLANAVTEVRPIPPEQAARSRERQLQIPGNIYGHIVRAMKQYSWTRELRKIDVPVLILQGLQDTMCPPGGSVIMHRNIRNSQLVMLDEAGHTLYWDQPEAWRRHYASRRLPPCQPGLWTTSCRFHTRGAVSRIDL